jgi:hypothetical protein
MERTTRDTLLMIAASTGAGALLAVVSERLFVNGGVGWDGGIYAALALQFGDLLAGKPFPYPVSYFRYLPSAVCWLVLKASGAPMTAASVITAFTWMTVALLGLMAFAWSRAAIALKMSAQGAWLGFMSLFLNYAVLKFAFYYPTLTDMFALAFSMFILCFYVLARPVLLCAVSVLGFFVWPVLPVIGCLLLVFPRKDVSCGREAPRLSLLFALAVIGIVYAAARPLHVEGLEQVFHTAMPLSIALVFLYLFFLIWGTLGVAGLFDPSLSRSEMRRLGLCAVLGLCGLGAAVLAVPGLWLELMVYVRGVVTTGIGRPAEFLVSHTLYFGPAVLLAVSNFRPSVQAVSRFGWGMALAVCLMGYQAINPLSRQCVIILPFLALLTALGLEGVRLGRGFMLFFAAFSLLLSKVWYLINTGIDVTIPGDQNPEFWPRYVNSTGFWMKTPDYLWQGAVIVAALFMLLLHLRTAGRADRAPGPGGSAS